MAAKNVAAATAPPGIISLAEEIEKAAADLGSDVDLLRERCKPFVAPDQFAKLARIRMKNNNKHGDRAELRARLDDALMQLLTHRARLAEILNALDL